MKKIITIVSLAVVVGCAVSVVCYLQKQRVPQEVLLDKGSLPERSDVTEQDNPSLTVNAKASDDREGKTEAKARSTGGSKEQFEGVKKASGEACQKIETAQAGQEKPVIEADPQVEMVATNKDPALVASEFIEALQQAVAEADVEAINSVLDTAPKSAECTDLLKRLVEDANSSAELCRYASEALARIGSQESVACLLDQVLTAYDEGDEEGATELMTPLINVPCGVEAAREMFDLLLGLGRYADYRENLPEDIRSSLRKALRNTEDREGVGNLAASLYVEPQVIVRRDALEELFDEVAPPMMLSRLSVQANQNGRTEDSAQFMDRLEQNTDQGTVLAFTQIGSANDSLREEAVDRLQTWSQTHPDQAMPGLFAEVINDSTRTPEERVVAASGLVGCADKEEADRMLQKAILNETDAHVVTNLQAALTALHTSQK